MLRINAASSVLEEPWLLVVLFAAGLITAIFTGLGLAAFARRRSRSYFLVTLALVALFARTLVALAATTGVLGATAHHLLEHSLDVTMAALVIAAVYYARRIEQHRTTEGAQ